MYQKITLALCLFTFTTTSFAHIYEWEYINPADPSQGRQESTTICPDGLGAVPERYADLSSLDLTQA